MDKYIKWLPLINFVILIAVLGLVITLMIRSNQRGDDIQEALTEIGEILELLMNKQSTNVVVT